MNFTNVPVITHIVSGDIWAGAEAQVYQLICGLIDHGKVKSTVVVFNPGILHDKLLELGVVTTLADERRLSPFGQVKRIINHLRDNDSTLVHTHGFKENILGTIAQHLSRTKYGLRTVHGNPEHGCSWRSPKRKLTDLLDVTIGRYGQDAIVAVSNQLFQDLNSKYPAKTVVINNFINPCDRKYTSTDKKPEKPNSLTLMFVGRLVPVKRVDLFIDTIFELRQRYGRDAKGLVFGDGPLIEELKIYAHRKGMTKSIRFEGFIQDMKKNWGDSNIFLMTSEHEGLPMSLLEALNHDVPIVAHDVGGIPEVLDNGRCGVLVNDHTATGYAEAIDELLKNPAKIQNFNKIGRKHLNSKFSAKSNVTKYESLYWSIIKRTPLPIPEVKLGQQFDYE